MADLAIGAWWLTLVKDLDDGLSMSMTLVDYRYRQWEIGRAVKNRQGIYLKIFHIMYKTVLICKGN
jgi:hypothetical protein